MGDNTSDFGNDPTARPLPAPRSRKRLLLVAGFGLVFVLCLAGGAWVYLRNAGGEDLDKVLAELDAADPGWRLDDIEAARADIPPAENSATVVQKAAKLLPGVWPSWFAGPRGGKAPQTTLTREFDQTIRELPSEVQLNRTQADGIRAELNAVPAAVAEARKLADLPAGRFPVARPRKPLSLDLHHNDVRQTWTLLRLDATLRAHDGQAEGALASGRGLLNAVRSLGDEPNLHAQLLRAGFRSTAALSMERTLAQGEPSPPALAEAQRLLEDELTAPLLRAGLRGERASNDALLRAYEKGDLKLGGGTGGRTFRERVQGLATGPLLRRQHVWTLRWLTDCVRAGDLPPAERLQRFSELETAAKANPPALPFGEMLVIRFAGVCPRTEAHLGCAVVALAAERYRRAHGRWPDSPDQLVPDYLRELPLDPFTGKPLRYQPTEDGVLISSPGPDEGLKGIAGEKPPYELRFRLWDPAKRRQPARP